MFFLGCWIRKSSGGMELRMTHPQQRGYICVAWTFIRLVLLFLMEYWVRLYRGMEFRMTHPQQRWWEYFITIKSSIKPIWQIIIFNLKHFFYLLYSVSICIWVQTVVILKINSTLYSSVWNNIIINYHLFDIYCN